MSVDALVWRPENEDGPRVEDERFLRGAGRFIADVAIANAASAAMLRSPHAHARLTAIRADAARAAPDVLGVFTAADSAVAALGSFPCEVELVNRDGTPLVVPPRRAMADDRVRHVGEIVAMVVAATAEAARDAAELIEVDYAPLPAVADLAEALAAPAEATLWPQAPGNLAFDWECGDADATDAAFARAARIVRLDLRNNRICPAPLEPRGAIGGWDEASGYTLHTSTQGGSYLRRLIARPMLGIEPERLRVVTPDVGGAFGAKLYPYPEQLLVLVAARALGRPVRWIAERGESFLSDYAARDQVNAAALALDAEGRFLALRVRSLANMGAFLSANAPHVPTTGSNKLLTGCYAIPAAHMQVRGVYTNTAPVEAYRGAGRPEALFVIERLVDRAARELRRDPVALRRLNAVPAAALPWRTPSGQRYHSVDFARILDGAVARADREGFAARRARSEAMGRARGFGVSLHLHGSSGMPGERAAIEVTPDGRVLADTAAQSAGQGHETVFARCVARLLGVPEATVTVRQGDTRHEAPAGGTGGSGSLIITATTLGRAADALIAAGMSRAASALGVDRSEIGFADGRYRARGRNLALDVLELARLGDGPLRGAAEFGAVETPSFPTGCHVCEVEIDRETGAVAVARFVAVVDIGRVAAPALALGQIHGGIAQGIGQALTEACRYDRDGGQLLSASLLDYALPRADDLPRLDVVLDGIPCASNPSGFKGVGELGTIGAPPAIINAIADALGCDVAMPATAAQLWRLLRG